nr:HTH-type transcriptional repressor KstR [Paraburkholderia busanensis]
MRAAKKTSQTQATTASTARTRTAKSPDHDTVSPRKLPRQQRAAATVAAILDAAASILERGGFDAYTTNAIAERAGASIGSLYQYFPNKTALTQALIAREDAALAVSLKALLDLPDEADLLRALIRVAVAHQLRRPVLARLLDSEEARLPVSDEVHQLDTLMKTIFRRCLGDTLIANQPHVPRDLFAIIHGMVDAAGQHQEDDSDALVARVERAVFGYLAVSA